MGKSENQTRHEIVCALLRGETCPPDADKETQQLWRQGRRLLNAPFQIGAKLAKQKPMEGA